MRIEEVPLDDARTYELLSSGNTLGCFQIDGRGMQGLLKKVKPGSINDISAVLALFRPGPIDSGSHTEYARRRHHGGGSPDIHPGINDALQPYLAETYGLIVYQEQVLSIINEVTGWGYAEAELIFSAMRKKKTDLMEKSRPGFFEAAQSRGHSKEAVQALWDVLVPFSDYSFNKAHATAYAHISYWTAYLKANHPLEYMTAVLTDEDDPDKFKEYIHELDRMGIDLLPPDINFSGLEFTPTSEGIRYGLASIKGVGASATNAILDKRPYASIDDFFRRASARVLNAGVLKALIESGCLDSLWPERESLLEDAVDLARMATDDRKLRTKGGRALVKTKYEPRSIRDRDFDLRSSLETERLGTAISAQETILRVPRELTDPEVTWMTRQLILRTGRSPVILASKGFQHRLPMKVNLSGLPEVMARIGVEVE